MARPLVVAAGEVLWDVLPDGDHLTACHYPEKVGTL